MHDINLLDDFLADLGFKLEPFWTSSQWIYDYGDEDEVSVWYSSGFQKWVITFRTWSDNIDEYKVSDKHFKSVTDLINFIQE